MDTKKITNVAIVVAGLYLARSVMAEKSKGNPNYFYPLSPPNPSKQPPIPPPTKLPPPPKGFYPLGWQKPFKTLEQVPGGWTKPFKPLQVSKPIDENPPIPTGVCIAAKIGTQQYNTLLSNANLIITNENQCNVVKDCTAGYYNVTYAPTAWWQAHQPELPNLYAPCGGN